MKSKCCGAGISGYGGMTPLGSTKITYFCGACGKPCELIATTDAKPEVTEVNGKTMLRFDGERTSMGSKATEAVKAYQIWLAEQQAAGCWFDQARLKCDFVHGYESTFEAGHHSRDAEISALKAQIAEFERRNREDVKDVLALRFELYGPEAVAKRAAEIQQREEAAAREAW